MTTQRAEVRQAVQAADPRPAAGGGFQLGAHIQRGDMAPWQLQGPHRFMFDAVGGCHVVLGFPGAAAPLHPEDLQSLSRLRHLIEGGLVAVFVMSNGAADRSEPGADWIKHVRDADGSMRRAYGIGADSLWVLLDPMLRVVEAIPARRATGAVRELCALAERLATAAPSACPPAPVLILPHVFEPAFCTYLIERYQQAGGRESGFMQEVAGRTVERHDPAWKRRWDVIIDDAETVGHMKARIARRVSFMLRQAFHFSLSRMERHLVACYAAADGGHFGPHRDDTVKATEHRRFAASINLNDDFDGGELSFPEFGPRAYKAPVGAALVFSGALLHRVRPVTRGRRFAYLPFLHDEEAEKVRVANLVSPAQRG